MRGILLQKPQHIKLKQFDSIQSHWLSLIYVFNSLLLRSETSHIRGKELFLGEQVS